MLFLESTLEWNSGRSLLVAEVPLSVSFIRQPSTLGGGQVAERRRQPMVTLMGS